MTARPLFPAIVLAFLLLALASAPAYAQGAPRLSGDRSIAVLPMQANEEDVLAAMAAAQVWPEVAYHLALDKSIRVYDGPKIRAEYDRDASAVEAAEDFGVRYIFMAQVSGEYIYRFDSTLRDGRTGAIVWGHVFFTDDHNIMSLAGEMGVTLRLVLNRIVP